LKVLESRFLKETGILAITNDLGLPYIKHHLLFINHLL